MLSRSASGLAPTRRRGFGSLLLPGIDAVTIFIMAPSMDILRRRITARGLDSGAVIDKRMKNAEAEIACRGMYRHVIVNDDLDTAVARFVSLLRGGVA